MSTKYLCKYFTFDLSVSYSENISQNKSTFKIDFSQQPNPPLNMILIEFNNGFSLKILRFLDWVDEYFEVPTLHCWQVGFRQKLFQFQLKYGLADYVKYFI